MRRGLFFTVAVGLGLLCPLGAMAQSLADVARAEEARRKSIKRPATKVYTNDDLARGRDTTVTPAPPAPAPGTPARPADASAPAADRPASSPEPPKDEKYWRNRITNARNALERSKAFFDALQSQINGLNTQFVNTDDPAQRSLVEQKRQGAIAEQNRVKEEIAQQTKAITAIQDEARRAGVPAGWLR